MNLECFKYIAPGFLFGRVAMSKKRLNWKKNSLNKLEDQLSNKQIKGQILKIC